MHARYPASVKVEEFADLQERVNRDMAPVHRARALLEGKGS